LEKEDSDLYEEILAHLKVLAAMGPALGRPRVDTLKGSRFSNMKELRIQFRGDPIRVLFAFDPKRQAVLLLGGNKGGDKRWYKVHVPMADKRYQEHLNELAEEDKDNG